MPNDLTSEYNVFCDTYDVKLSAKMATIKDKKKVEMKFTNASNIEMKVSLWKEDVQLMVDFLQGMVESLDSKLK